MKEKLIILWKISLVIAVIVLLFSAWNAAKEKSQEEINTEIQGAQV